MRSFVLLRALRPFGLLFILVLAFFGRAAAKGSFSTVVIMDLETGEGFQVSDASLESFFALSDFSDGTRESPTVGKGYELTRGITRNGVFLAIDRLRYYAPGSQPHGYVFYEGLINGSSEYDGKWFPSTRAGEATMTRILTSSETPRLVSTSLQVGAIAGVAGLLGGFILGRKFPRGHRSRPA